MYTISSVASQAYGVDVLRLWVAGHATSSASILVGDAIMSHTKQDLDRLRNTFKFLLGNVPSTTDCLLEVEALRPLDLAALQRALDFEKDVAGFYETMQYTKICLRVQNFIAHGTSMKYGP